MSGARLTGCGPWRQQAILGRSHVVPVLYETGFLKQGKASREVALQYTGSADKAANNQVGVFASYVSCHGHAFIDRALHLPKTRADDRNRMATAQYRLYHQAGLVARYD